jgi:hypothetical protein
MTKLLDAINGVAVVSLWGIAVWAWPRLPERIPLHFGIDGAPDRWGAPSLVNWFLLPTMVLALNLVLLLTRRWMASDPARINLPGGGRVDELPAPARRAVVRLLASTLAVVQLLMNLVFLLVLGAQYNAAMGHPSRHLLGGVLVLSLLSGPVFLVVYFLRLQKALATEGTHGSPG